MVIVLMVLVMLIIILVYLQGSQLCKSLMLLINPLDNSNGNLCWTK